MTTTLHPDAARLMPQAERDAQALLAANAALTRAIEATVDVGCAIRALSDELGHIRLRGGWKTLDVIRDLNYLRSAMSQETPCQDPLKI